MLRRTLFLGFLSGIALPLKARETEVDLVIIGAGAAGLSAAVSAAQEGLRDIVVLEKAPFAGGHSVLSGGSVNSIDPERQLKQGISDSPERWKQEIMETGANRSDPKLVDVLVSEAPSTIEWLSGFGVRFRDEIFEAWSGRSKRAHSADNKRSGFIYIRALNKKARELGVKILLSTKAESLITEDGQVKGVRFKAKDGSIGVIRARNVIIATGGFTANTQMRTRFDKRLDSSLKTTADPAGSGFDGSTGEGILMAVKAGAMTVDMDAVQLIPLQGGRVLNYTGGDILVDSRGERFVNEGAEVRFILEAFLNLPDRQMWVITDSQSQKNDMFEPKLISGIVQKADSVQEMAQKMGVDPHVLSHTLNRYNRFVKQGYDEDFGKRVFTQQINQPPYYFGKERFDIHYSCGGLKIDEETRVLDQSGFPIPNLYAVGEVTGGIHGSDRLGGNSLIDCFVFGRRAGKSAAKNTLKP